jgi:hypothetical protein
VEGEIEVEGEASVGLGFVLVEDNEFCEESINHG